MKDPYSILGVSKNATDEEVKNAYRELVRKYHPDNYADDNPLKDLANEKMQDVNEAYDEIMRMRQNASSSSSSSGAGGNYSNNSSGIYAEIRRTIQARRFSEAEKMLLSVPNGDRTAEWHYLASVLLMHRGRQNDAMRELEIACGMDPNNLEYQKAKEMFNNTARGYGSSYYASTGTPARSNSDEACNCCANLLCMDCLCECLGGDFISCI